MSLLEFLLVTTIIGTGAALQGSIGIGLGLLAGPLLVILNPAYVPGPLLLAAFLLSIGMAYREKQAMDLSGVKNALMGRIVGIGLALLVLVFVPSDQLTLLFGGVVLMAVWLSISKFSVRPTRVNVTGVGILSGFMSTVASMGGVPMALLYQNAAGARIRSTLSGYYILGNLISFPALVLIGKFGIPEISLFLGLIPGVVLGFLLSTRATVFVDHKNMMKKAILSLATISALIAIIKAII